MIRFGGPVFLEDNARVAGAGESHGAVVGDPAVLARAHKMKGFTAAYAPKIDLCDGAMIRGGMYGKGGPISGN